MYGGRDSNWESQQSPGGWYLWAYVADDKCRGEVDALLGHEAECLLVNQVSVFDAADTRLDGISSALRGEAVRSDQRAALRAQSAACQEVSHRGRLAMLRTVSQIALISATVNWELSSLSVRDATPPELQILMWSAPFIMIFLATFRQASTATVSQCGRTLTRLAYRRRRRRRCVHQEPKA